MKWLYWGIFIVGGLGTFLAAIGKQVWIALTTSIVAAFGTYLGYRQTERTLMKYNQAATDLANVKAWWNALSSEEQSKQENIDSLVEHTEQVLQTELDGWIQQMQNSLAELRKEQEAKFEREENKEPQKSAKAAEPDNNNAKTGNENVVEKDKEDGTGSQGNKTAEPTTDNADIENKAAEITDVSSDVEAKDGVVVINNQDNKNAADAKDSESSLNVKDDK